MKTFVLMISEKFPANHDRAGQDTHFIEKIKSRTKLHTLRGNYQLWAKRAMEINANRAVLSVRVWEGIPYRSRQIEIMQFTTLAVERLEYMTILNTKANVAKIENAKPIPIEQLAQNDGLTPADFRSWFTGYDMPNEMAVLHFTDYFLYNEL